MARKLQKIARFLAPYMVVVTKHYLRSYLLTLRSTVLLEKLTGS